MPEMLEFSSLLIIFTFVALCRLFILTASIFRSVRPTQCSIFLMEHV